MWLEEILKCQYLPENDMKQLCEMVKELLMEGEGQRHSRASAYLLIRIKYYTGVFSSNSLWVCEVNYGSVRTRLTRGTNYGE